MTCDEKTALSRERNTEGVTDNHSVVRMNRMHADVNREIHY